MFQPSISSTSPSPSPSISPINLVSATLPGDNDDNNSMLSSPSTDMSMQLSNLLHPLICKHPNEASGPFPTNIPDLLLVAVSYPDSLARGLSEIARFCPHSNFVTGENMWDWDEDQDEVRYVSASNEAITAGRYLIQTSHLNYRQCGIDEKFELRVIYNRQIEAFRALGRILGVIIMLDDSGDMEELRDFGEEAQFDTVGVMMDCSRCGVLTVDTVFYMLRSCALLGMNTFQLYTEDTFKIDGEPFFGYLRGSYSQEELHSIDNYGFDFGIEVFPCIQTLGHLGQILQWPRFANLRDTSEVLLANSEETYQFIDKMIESASRPFRSNRIHIGMDEAHGVGEGRFKQLFGIKDCTLVFLEHLQRVAKICRERGLKPLMWSDMLFTLAAKNSSLQTYYDPDAPAPTELGINIPPDLGLVYWDYYHTNSEVYSHKIRQHRDLSFEPWVAALPFTLEASRACLMSSKANNIKNIYVTTWGDDGNECDIYSALPGFVYFAEHAYTKLEPTASIMRRTFLAICGGDLDDWINASHIDCLPSQPVPTDSKTYFPPNMSKWLLWEDPIYSMLSPQHQNFNITQYYGELEAQLQNAAKKSPKVYPINSRLLFPALISAVLTLKTNLRKSLVAAYSPPPTFINPSSASNTPTSLPSPRLASTPDKQKIYIIATTTLLTLRQQVDRLWKFHRDRIWLDCFKPFGLEILELRYGAIRIRLESLNDRLMAFVNSEIDRIEELEVTLWKAFDNDLGLVLDFTRAFTPSRALGTG
ncbi:hypothetical protein HK096_011446 [Nowakowskiella sp. JEL0078]|nr:hypothetical protein HK096_011446 [Nowakowskiella sp. JEL0078]